MSYVLGIDLGTGSLKGVLMDENGQIILTRSREYALLQPKKGFMEQNPQDWIDACHDVLIDIQKSVADFSEKLKGISFSGQMHSLVVLDETFEPLRPAILWNDTRTSLECEKLMSEYKNELIDITSNIALEGFTLPKILWLQKNEPEIWSQVRHLLLPKDYLGFWMTGHLHMDYSDASGTIMFDMRKKTWSKSILNKYGIPESYLPKLIHSSGQIGVLNNELCEKLNIKHEVKIFAGGADNACAAIGSGVLDENSGMISIGTSGVFLSYEAENHNNYLGKLHLFHHGVENGYYSMGVTLAAGHSLTWFKETFANGLSYDALLSPIKNVPIGSNGLLFSPYITGERTPYTDSKIRGSFIGLDTSHTLHDLTRAVLEGITFSLKDCEKKMTQLSSQKFDRIVSVGGGAQNSEWLQMQADIFDAEIVCLKTEQGPGVGAAMLAAVGLGWFEDLRECAATFVSYEQSIQPNQESVSQYQRVYQLYQQTYLATRDICHDLVDLSQ